MKTSACVGWVVRLLHTGTVPSFITQRWKPGTGRLYMFMRCFPLTAWPQGAGLPRFMFMVCQWGADGREGDGEHFEMML